MGDAKDIVEIAADGVADGMHIIGEEALAVEKAVRSTDKIQFSYIALGVAAGAAAGAVLGYIVASRKLETKYSQISAEEISEMRQHYADKVMALENRVERTSLADLVKQERYSSEEFSTEPPLAVAPPTAVVDAANEQDEEEVNVPLTDLVQAPSEVRNVFREAVVTHEWDDHKERRNRSPVNPYVIHRDEREEKDAYDEVTFTYYEEDDVLCNERDEVVASEDRNRLIGEANLERFGHGSGDASIVYIRNDQLEMVFEVVRSPNSYAEEVHGFEPEIRHSDRLLRERRHFDDE